MEGKGWTFDRKACVTSYNAVAEMTFSETKQISGARFLVGKAGKSAHRTLINYPRFVGSYAPLGRGYDSSSRPRQIRVGE